MGLVCVKPEPAQRIPHLEQTDHIKIVDINELKAVRFEFTNRKVASLTGDLLALFMGHNINVRSNDHFLGAQV